MWNLKEEYRLGRIPRVFFESDDPDRLVPLVWEPEDYMIVGDRRSARNNAYVFAHNGVLGYPVTKKIDAAAARAAACHEERLSVSLRRRRDIWDVVVVGGGIGGLTAAWYTARRGLPTALLETQGLLGGQVATVNTLDDWPATAEVSGVELAASMSEKLSASAVDIRHEAAVEVTHSKDTGLLLVSTEERTLRARRVIAASGASLRPLGVAGRGRLRWERHLAVRALRWLLLQGSGRRGRWRRRFGVAGGAGACAHCTHRHDHRALTAESEAGLHRARGQLREREVGVGFGSGRGAR